MKLMNTLRVICLLPKSLPLKYVLGDIMGQGGGFIFEALTSLSSSICYLFF
jgi:hypothetical protein